MEKRDFLQSDEWRHFQEAVGRRTYNISSEGFYANVIEHTLPIAGKYFYVPRGPVSCNMKHETGNKGIKELIGLAEKNNAGWIRVEPETEEMLEEIRVWTSNVQIKKAPHDMQPRELFIIDITKPEEQLLSEMKSKTRYNIRLAEKKDVKVLCITNHESRIKYIKEFVRLTGVMAKRNGIQAHPGEYYRKMFEVVPESILKLYIAEYEGRVICANLVVFYGKTCIYLHGASDDTYRNVMAPFLLQWRQILDAKAVGCERYDFGGVKVNLTGGRSWAGVTRFKIGFSPKTKPTEFPGCYDVVISPAKYGLYRTIQRIKNLIK